MAEFSKLTITDKGQALIAKVVAGTAETQFTKVCTSSFQYENEMLESLTEISDIKQTSLISNVKRTSDSQITVEVGFTNVELTSGYYIRALGLYALDPDEGEILYGVTLETSGECHMPAYNGVTVGGAIMRLSTSVGNAEKVSLEVDPGAFVIMSQFEGHTHSAEDIKSGIMSIEHGGTGKSSVTSGNFLVGNGTDAMQEKTPAEALLLMRTKLTNEILDDIKTPGIYFAEEGHTCGGTPFSFSGNTVLRTAPFELYVMKIGDSCIQKYFYGRPKDYGSGYSNEYQIRRKEGNSGWAKWKKDMPISNLKDESYDCSISLDSSSNSSVGKFAVSLGMYTSSKRAQLTCGRQNVEYDGDNSVPADGGTTDSTEGTAFIVGNGFKTTNGSIISTTKSNSFRVTYDGHCYGQNAFAASGADYAEYFEWIDGNPDNEDRRGYFVALDGAKIRKATAEDDYILGVISATPVIEGNTYSDMWQGMYLTDIFGERLTETVEVPETTDEESGEVIPSHTEIRFILNPDYDYTKEYKGRNERPEWAAVGMFGQLVVVDDGTCEANGYCKVADGGIATKADGQTSYRVMERLDDTHIRVLIK